MPLATGLQARRKAAFQRAGPLRPRRAARQLSVSVHAANVMIVNTKKGGHAFIGLYLAKKLTAGGHSVTIFNDGDQVRIPTESLKADPGAPPNVASGPDRVQ
jgi:hypothetical protein